MKKILALLLVIVMALGGFSACKKYDDETGKPSTSATQPTNEELIAKKINKFLTAYNTGDMDEVLKCLDAKTRNELQAWMNLLGGVAGGLLGFDISLSDLFTLGISMAKEDFMKLEIKNITIIDASNAVVTTVMDMIGDEESTTIYFEMVYEDDGWYIHDMTDVKPSGSNGEQSGEDGEQSGSFSNAGDDTENTDSSSGNSNTDDGATEIEESKYIIEECNPFADGRAWVKYYNIEDRYSPYYGFIDMQGNVLYSTLARNAEVYNIGKGSAIAKSENELVLIDESGTVKMTLSGQADVKIYGGGFAFIYQNKSTISTLEHLYGIVNYAGEWIMPMENLQEEGCFDMIEYIGDGFVGEVRWRESTSYSIINMNTKMFIRLNDICSDCNIAFTNGMAFVDRSIFYSDTISITVAEVKGQDYEITHEYEASNACIIYADGRVVELPSLAEINYKKAFYNGIAVSNEKIETEDGKYYQITDYTESTPVTVEFTKYPASQIEGILFNGKYGLVQIRGLDEKTYVTMIDTQGNELISPLQDKYLSDFILAPNGYAYYKQDSVYYIVDKDGNTTKTEMTSGGWSGNISFDIGWEVGAYRNTYYIKPNGEKLFQYLTVD